MTNDRFIRVPDVIGGQLAAHWQSFILITLGIALRRGWNRRLDLEYLLHGRQGLVGGGWGVGEKEEPHRGEKLCLPVCASVCAHEFVYVYMYVHVCAHEFVYVHSVCAHEFVYVHVNC